MDLQFSNKKKEKTINIFSSFYIGAKTVFVTLFTSFITLLFTIILHIIFVKLYNYHCIHEGWFSIIHSFMYMSSSQCRFLLESIKTTSDTYFLFLINIFSIISLRLKFLK